MTEQNIKVIRASIMAQCGHAEEFTVDVDGEAVIVAHVENPQFRYKSYYTTHTHEKHALCDGETYPNEFPENEAKMWSQRRVFRQVYLFKIELTRELDEIIKIMAERKLDPAKTSNLSFERKRGDPSSTVNVIDFNGDGEVDYVSFILHGAEVIISNETHGANSSATPVSCLENRADSILSKINAVLGKK